MTVYIYLLENRRIFYFSAGNASRGCSLDGTWEERTDYNNCRPLSPKDNCFNDPSSCEPSDLSLKIYCVGYTLSLLALVLALIIFLSFRQVHISRNKGVRKKAFSNSLLFLACREMRCLRNKIHTNLFITIILSNSCFIVTALVQVRESVKETLIEYSRNFVYFHTDFIPLKL